MNARSKPGADCVTDAEELLLIKSGRPLVVNLQLKKPTLIASREQNQRRGDKEHGKSHQAATAMELLKIHDTPVSLKNLREQRTAAKSPQVSYTLTQQNQRFQRKGSQPLIRTQSMHKFRNANTSKLAASVACSTAQQLVHNVQSTM